MTYWISSKVGLSSTSSVTSTSSILVLLIRLGYLVRCAQFCYSGYDVYLASDDIQKTPTFVNINIVQGHFDSGTGVAKWGPAEWL